MRPDSRQSKRPPGQMAEPSAGHADAELVTGLRDGLRHYHAAPADGVAHLLLFRYLFSHLLLLTSK